jgi:glycosyltransferase involved in cell wall biosynthesis
VESKVLINVPHLDLPGGVAYFYRVLRKYLGPGAEYFEIGSKAGERGIFAQLRRALGDYWRFHRRLSGGEISLVHLNPSLGPRSMIRESLFILISRAHGIPVVVFFRGWDDGFRQLIERRLLRLFRFIFGGAAAIIVLADDFRRQLQEMGIRAPILTMSTLVDDTVFEQPARYSDAHSGINILFLSRLVPGKGLVEVIEAFKLLKRTTPEVTLLIAGDGPEKEKAEQIIDGKKANDVVFLGHVDDDEKRQAFLNSDIYFFPTFYSEGMPNSVLEAMAYGLPVVTRPVGGLADFFENERMGFMTESDDPADFARLLERLAKDVELRRRTGAYNRRYAREHFAASRIADGLEATYAHVLRRSGDRRHFIRQS